MIGGLRRMLVAALIVALTLAGLGRALAITAQIEGAYDVIPGVHTPICHSGAAHLARLLRRLRAARPRCAAVCAFRG